MKPLMKKLVGYFIRGFLSLLPLIATVYIVSWLFRLIERTAIDWVVAFIPVYNRQFPGVVIAAEIITAIGLFFLVAGFGVFVRTFFGRRLVALVEGIFNAIPGINSIYKTIRQAVELFSLRKSMGTMQPALVQYPSPGVYAIAFITGVWDERLSPEAGKKFVTVFMPTTPNPTSGFLMLIPAALVHPLDLPMEQVLKLVLTGGMVKK